MKEKYSLADHHTHAQDVCFHEPTAAKNFGVEVGDHLYPHPEIQRYVDHVLKNNLDTLWVIYEDVKRFSEIKETVVQARPDCAVKGFYFIRNPKNIDKKQFSRLHKAGFVQGLKIHPVIDNYALLPENVDGVMQLAQKHDLPVIYHSDDRAVSMHLTSPENQRELAKTYPQVRLMIGHGGAYAHPRIVGERNTGAIGYWRRSKDLINAALSLSAAEENVYYETSVATNAIKAGLIKEFVEANPHAALKILLGSDFPVAFARLDTQLTSLENAGLSTRFISQIAANRL